MLESGERLAAACTCWADAADNIDVGTSAQLLDRSKAVLYAVLSSDGLSTLAAPRINGVDGESGSFKLRRLDSRPQPVPRMPIEGAGRWSECVVAAAAKEVAAAAPRARMRRRCGHMRAENKQRARCRPRRQGTPRARADGATSSARARARADDEIDAAASDGRRSRRGYTRPRPHASFTYLL